MSVESSTQDPVPWDFLERQPSVHGLDEDMKPGCEDNQTQPKMIGERELSISGSDDIVSINSSVLSSPRNMKTRQHLQLPPFKSLGIAAPHPDVLLTPPDECDSIRWSNSSQYSALFPSSSPCQHPRILASEGTTPETPLVSEFMSATTAEAPQSSQATEFQASEPMDAQPDEGVQNISAPDTHGDNNDERSAWLKGAIRVTCMLNEP